MENYIKTVTKTILKLKRFSMLSCSPFTHYYIDIVCIEHVSTEHYVAASQAC